MPAIEAEQETVAVPEPGIVPGVNAAHVNPVGITSVRVTVPAKWFWAVIVMVERADCPALSAAGDVAVKVKFWMMNRTVVLCTSEELVPVTVSV